MTKTHLLQEIRCMRFTELYGSWRSGRLSQMEAAYALGVSEQTFRRWQVRYEEDGAEGLADRRIGRLSARRAPVDEVTEVLGLFKTRYNGRILQIPKSQSRSHYVKVQVRAHEYPDGSLAVFHGPRCLARYSSDSSLSVSAEAGKDYGQNQKKRTHK